MCENECMHGYFEVTKQTIENFGVPATREQSYFVQPPKNINLTDLFCVKYERIFDNGGCFSLNNVIFRVERIECPRNKKNTVMINKKIGVMALHDDKRYHVTPILDKNKKAVNSTESVEMIIANFVYYHCLKNERIV